jgi:hypothetical protein
MSSGRALAARQGSSGSPATAVATKKRSSSSSKQTPAAAAAAAAAGELQVIQNPLHFSNNAGIVYFL